MHNHTEGGQTKLCAAILRQVEETMAQRRQYHRYGNVTPSVPQQLVNKLHKS